jgi:hypothetical protein
MISQPVRQLPQIPAAVRLGQDIQGAGRSASSVLAELTE